MSNILEFA